MELIALALVCQPYQIEPWDRLERAAILDVKAHGVVREILALRDHRLAVCGGTI